MPSQRHDLSFDLRDPASYDHWTEVTLRFGDEDRMGHINNASYVVYLEASRVDYLAAFLEPDSPIDMVLAHLEVDYLQETTYPGRVHVGARLMGYGTRSMRSGYAVFRDRTCLVTCQCVNVFFDTRTRRSTPPSEAGRARLAAELARLGAVAPDVS